MSKAFTKDDDTSAALLVPARAPLPAGIPNYVTPRGLALLQAEQAAVDAERAALDSTDSPDRVARSNALLQRSSDLQARIASAQLIEPGLHRHEEARFGATVRVRHASGKSAAYQIVGVDEADAGSGRIAFCSPLGRALLGKRTGEVAELRAPRHSEELEIVGIDYLPDERGEG